MTIKELKGCNSRVKLGDYGEQLVASLLGGRVDHQNFAGDLECGAYGRVEVKTAIPSDNRGSRVVRFCIQKDDQHGKTYSYNADWIAFVIASLYGDSVYLVPRWQICQKHICMSTENFARKFANFKIN